MNPMTRLGMAAWLLFCPALLSLAAQDAVPQIVAPDVRTNWTVEVRTSGGLNGQGIGGYTITSAGRLTCAGPKPCDLQIQRSALRSLSGLVESMDLLLWGPRSMGNRAFQLQMGASLCADCIVNSMVLRIRDSNLTEWTYQASWDVTTQSTLPPDFKRIFETVTALQK